MTFNFENSKKLALGKKDKSSIQGVDAPIRDLVSFVNVHDDYFTTSSCSGRTVLIKDEEKKQPGLFLFRTHERISFKELKEALEKISEENKKGRVMFKQEPCLLVVSCKNKDSQWKLFSLARNNGWKKSGILSIDKKLLIELMSTETISFPILDRGKILVDDEFLRLVLERANKNLDKGWEKIKRLERLVEKL
ncbi:MAG: tRNA wybutosine-synthesizing protein 3 [archaeon]|jgi:tRNA wybutosine-synthesizing protein 3